MSPYESIRLEESSEKVGCSIELAWVGMGAAFDDSGHSEVSGERGSKGKWGS